MSDERLTKADRLTDEEVSSLMEAEEDRMSEIFSRAIAQMEAANPDKQKRIVSISQAQYSVLKDMAIRGCALAKLVGTRYGELYRQLQARVDGLELHGVKYCGAYQRALSYRRGLVVTCDSSMWIALKNTPEGVKPGTAEGAEYWQLSAKSTANAPKPEALPKPKPKVTKKTRVTAWTDDGRIKEIETIEGDDL